MKQKIKQNSWVSTRGKPKPKPEEKQTTPNTAKKAGG